MAGRYGSSQESISSIGLGSKVVTEDMGFFPCVLLCLSKRNGATKRPNEHDVFVLCDPSLVTNLGAFSDEAYKPVVHLQKGVSLKFPIIPLFVMSPRPIKTAVVGVGLAGTVFHLPLLVALPDLFDVCIVVERNPQQQGGKARKFGISPKVVETLEEAILDPDIELVRCNNSLPCNNGVESSVGRYRYSECNALSIRKSRSRCRKARYFP